MRMTLNVPDELITAAMKDAEVQNKTAVIVTALEEYVRKRKRERLIALRGDTVSCRYSGSFCPGRRSRLHAQGKRNHGSPRRPHDRGSLRAQRNRALHPRSALRHDRRGPGLVVEGVKPRMRQSARSASRQLSRSRNARPDLFAVAQRR